MENSGLFPPSYISSKQVKKPGVLAFIPYSVKNKKEKSKSKKGSVESQRGSCIESIKLADNFVSVDLDNNEAENETNAFVPCYFVRCKTGSSKIALYFHSEKQDLGEESSTILSLCHYLKCHIIAIEYPGYGISFEEKFNFKDIVLRGCVVFEYLTSQIGFLESDIILIGNSVGAQCALELSNKYQALACIPINIFRHNKSLLLSGNYCSGSSKESILKLIHNSKTSLFIINSENDSSKNLGILEDIKNLPSNKEKPCHVELRPTISHNYFRPNSDIVVPFIRFIESDKEVNFGPNYEYSDKINYLNLEDYEELLVTPSKYDSERLTQKVNEHYSKCCTNCTIF